MFNILLDELPEEWNGYKIDVDFQIGIMISQCMADEELSKAERIYTAIGLLFPDEENRPLSIDEALDGISWFLNDWNHDNLPKSNKKSDQIVVMDFDIDQWRIYAAFKKQYAIDLNTEPLHFWVFMGLLSNLEGCNFTEVISIREKKIDSKMSKEEKEHLRKAKNIYRITKNSDTEETQEEKAERQKAIDEFNRIRNKS